MPADMSAMFVIQENMFVRIPARSEVPCHMDLIVYVGPDPDVSLIKEAAHGHLAHWPRDMYLRLQLQILKFQRHSNDSYLTVSENMVSRECNRS